MFLESFGGFVGFAAFIFQDWGEGMWFSALETVLSEAEERCQAIFHMDVRQPSSTILASCH